MPEYVYALHDFQPEHEDEVPFRAGERIEVIEKDDAYGDGWWQGRNLSGKTGLFPQSYTAPAPPTPTTATSPEFNAEPSTPTTSTSTSTLTVTDPETRTPLQPLHEEPEIDTPLVNGTPAIYINGNEHQNGDGEVMQATMTDVQKAIEQLGRNRASSVDGSFSFASSRDGAETDETDFDVSDADGEDNNEKFGEGWHKGARRRLAEKARRAVEEAEKLEMMMNDPSERMRHPPIEVEMSDESEGEDDEEDYTRASGFNSIRRHSNILEEDEDEVDSDGDGKGRAGDARSLTPPREVTAEEEEAETHPELPTATGATFPNSPEPEEVDSSVPSRHHSLPTPISPMAATQANPLSPRRSSTPLRESVTASEVAASLPSPTATSMHETSKHSSLASATATAAAAAAADPPPATSSSTLQPPSQTEETRDKDKVPPNEWTVEEVVEWLKTKGFGVDVCEKFTEQEITGDVLLDLDVNLLKTEIGIIAYGKRVRIANAITDLRRPPSIVYSDHPDMSPMGPHSPGVGVFPQTPTSYQHQVHSRTQSQSVSHHSYPGTANHSSVRSSMHLLSPEKNGSASRVSEFGAVADGQQEAVNGNGNGKSRPSHLALSPSDSNLGSSVTAVSDTVDGLDDERTALSETEAAPIASGSSTRRRRLFGRSNDSAASGTKESVHSKEGISPASLHSDKDKEEKKEKEKESPTGTRHARARKSVDHGDTSGHRLSIFGGTFGGTIGKGRKPPPRYSTAEEAPAVMQKSSSTGSGFLPKFGSGSGKKSSRPSTSEGPRSFAKEREAREARELEKQKEKEKASSTKSHSPKDHRDPQLLRKRTSSYPGINGGLSSPNSNSTSDTARKASDSALLSPQLKKGQSILEQIGHADHSGWMRKKSDRYNSWKLRYFVLKGPHMYCLKSNSPSETKIKGYINIIGYKVVLDENINPGKYNFRIEHESDKTHFFSSEEKSVIRDWMKAVMKATIGRDYTKPVMSSCNVPTIPLMVAQAMNPAPRPPSPTARAATQKALRREDPNQLSSRDKRILMIGEGDGKGSKERGRLDFFFSNETMPDTSSIMSGTTFDVSTPRTAAPPRPSREARRNSSATVATATPIDQILLDWANSHLPTDLQVVDSTTSTFGGLALLRLAESIKGRPASPPVPDSAFPTDPNDDKLEGLFKLFDFLLDNDVKMGSISINDIRQCKRDKVIQLLRALKLWEEKRRALAQSIGKGSVQAGGFMAPLGMASNGI